MKNLKNNVIALAAAATLATGGFAYGQLETGNSTQQPVQNLAPDGPNETGSADDRDDVTTTNRPANDRQQRDPAGRENDMQRTTQTQPRGMQQGQMNQGQMNQMGQRDDRPQMSPEQVKQMETEFVKWSASGHEYAIQSADIASQKADQEYVKEYARLVKRDHEQAKQLLSQAAEQAGYDVPQGIQYDVLKDKLENLRQEDKQFAEKYIFGTSSGAVESAMWNAHFVENGESPELRQYAAQVLPVEAVHQQAGEQVAVALIRGVSDGEFTQARQAGARMGGQNGRMSGMNNQPGTTPNDPNFEEIEGQRNAGAVVRPAEPRTQRPAGNVTAGTEDETDVDEGAIQKGLPGARDAANIDPNDVENE